MNTKVLNPIFIKRVLRFGISGVLVTILHVLIASAFIEFISPMQSVANGVAFVVATIASYLIHTKWSFSSSLHGKNLFRFCTVSCFGLFLAMAISGIAQMLGLHYWYGIAAVVCMLPPVTFLLHNCWTYR